MATRKSQSSNVPFQSVLLRPRITEKAGIAGEKNVYTFDVAPRANKALVAGAIEHIYKVKPLRVNIITIPQKRVMVRGKWGMKEGGKKALVLLKKGEKIEFV